MNRSAGVTTSPSKRLTPAANGMSAVVVVWPVFQGYRGGQPQREAVVFVIHQAGRYRNAKGQVVRPILIGKIIRFRCKARIPPIVPT